MLENLCVIYIFASTLHHMADHGKESPKFYFTLCTKGVDSDPKNC